MFESPCRICKCWSVQNRHWICNERFSMWSDGHYEECEPSDNLEYLEYLYNKKGINEVSK
jgi:hypothetical protein